MRLLFEYYWWNVLIQHSSKRFGQDRRFCNWPPVRKMILNRDGSSMSSSSSPLNYCKRYRWSFYDPYLINHKTIPSVPSNLQPFNDFIARTNSSMENFGIGIYDIHRSSWWSGSSDGIKNHERYLSKLLRIYGTCFLLFGSKLIRYRYWTLMNGVNKCSAHSVLCVRLSRRVSRSIRWERTLRWVRSLCRTRSRRSCWSSLDFSGFDPTGRVLSTSLWTYTEEINH